MTFVGGPTTAYPRWSPDGKLIAFASARDGPMDLYLLDPLTRNLQQLTSSPGDEWYPAWSRDGRSSTTAWLYSRPTNRHSGRSGRSRGPGERRGRSPSGVVSPPRSRTAQWLFFACPDSPDVNLNSRSPRPISTLWRVPTAVARPSPGRRSRLPIRLRCWTTHRVRSRAG